MKKSKLSIGLVTSFIGALALTACNETASSVTKSKDSVVDFIGYNSKTDRIEINTDELYREYGESKEGTTLYYNAVLESLIRYEYPLISKKDDTLKKYSRIESEAADKIKASQQTARENAKANDTSYDAEWDKILKANDVESTKDLKLKFIYELEKEAMTDWYFKKHVESTDTETGLREQYLGVTENWDEVNPSALEDNVDPVYPYHILHILVKLDADATNYTRATITESEAKKLWAVVRQLIDGQYTFIETSKLSDDTSKDEFGDVELMTTHTSFYNEFKLGVYAYDALLSKVNTQDSSNSAIYKAFGLDEEDKVVTQTLQSTEVGHEHEIVETKEKVVDLVQQEMASRVNTNIEHDTSMIPTIPFDVFRRIGEAAEETKIGTFEPEGSSVSLPRNVLFNNFLNFRSPFVITNELLDEDTAHHGGEIQYLIAGTDDAQYAVVDADSYDAAVAHYGKLFESDGQEGYIESEQFIDGNTYFYESVVENKNSVSTTTYNFDDEEIIKLESNNFQEGKVAGLGKKVLCDTDGNVVIGVRSTAGIHFMVMRKSVFENTNISVGRQDTSLEDYYTTLVPGDEGFPEDKQTFVNMKNSKDSKTYSERADIIKNDIKSTSTFDAAYDYRLYEALLDYKFDGSDKTIGERIHFSDEDENHNSVIRTNIDKMISLLRETHHYSQLDSINNSWKEYLLQLRYQNELRSEEGMFANSFVPTTCAFSFSKGNEADWKEGGKCYVK